MIEDDEPLSRPMQYEAVTRLGQDVHEVVLTHMIRQPKDEAAVLEALNALAAVVATVLRGCRVGGIDFNGRATQFFFMALTGCTNVGTPRDPKETLQ